MSWREHPRPPSHYIKFAEIYPITDAYERGVWFPPNDPLQHRINSPNRSYEYLYCNGESIEPLRRPPNIESILPLKEFSVYHNQSHIYVLPCDITRYSARPRRNIGQRSSYTGQDEQDAYAWHQMMFTHDTYNLISSAVIGGEEHRLRTQRADQLWPSKLLPSCYHSFERTNRRAEGGMNGDLPLLMALVGFTSIPNQVAQRFESCFRNGNWNVDEVFAISWNNQIQEKRGFVIGLYPLSNDSWPVDMEKLERYEESRIFP